ncbi:HK97-gp10 family putative phage morphogenesis protein [Undibacterium sp.]|uniref:HK97-gp10 family putative phage morphogenesis protein n=1 Tax=Undibacterium sp. TaxID=1914977 RepID=UPI0037530345
MANTVSAQVVGLQALGKRLQSLSYDVQKKIASSATSAGAAVVRKAAKSIVNKNSRITGDLEKRIVSRKDKKTALTSMHSVTVRRKGATENDPENKGIFIEFGTVTAAAEPFLRPAFDNNKEAAAQKIIDVLQSGITKAGA